MNKHCSWKAFTLVELLVVIAIISVLASLLLPVLAAARDTAYSVSCLNNTKQIGIWGMSYADEWDSILPHNASSNNGGDAYWHTLSKTWWVTKHTSAAGRQWVGTDPVRWVMYVNPANNSLKCPKVNSFVTFKQEANVNYNINTMMASPGSVLNYTGKSKPQAHVMLKSDKLWFWDAHFGFNGNTWHNSNNVGSMTSGEPPFNWRFTRDPEHFGLGHPTKGFGANFLFGDGHSKTLQYAWWKSLTTSEKDKYQGKYLH